MPEVKFEIAIHRVILQPETGEGERRVRLCVNLTRKTFNGSLVQQLNTYPVPREDVADTYFPAVFTLNNVRRQYLPSYLPFFSCRLGRWPPKFHRQLECAIDCGNSLRNQRESQNQMDILGEATDCGQGPGGCFDLRLHYGLAGEQTPTSTQQSL